MVITEYKMPVKANLLFTIFIAIWGTVGLLIMITISVGIIDCSCSYEFLSAVLLILVAIIFAYNLVVWRLAGIEIIQLYNNGLLLIRQKTLFRKRRFISFNDFESIDADNDVTTPRLIKLYKIGGGKIKIKYLGRSTRIGMSIHIQDANSIVSEINEKIKDMSLIEGLIMSLTTHP